MLLILPILFAKPELCKDHPFSQQNYLLKFLKKIDLDKESAFSKILDTFNSNSTQTASEEFGPIFGYTLKEKIMVNDGLTCCDQEVTNQLLEIPNLFIRKFIKRNKSVLEKVLGSIPRTLRNCGGNRGSQGLDKKMHDPTQFSVIQIMQRVWVKLGLDFTLEKGQEFDGEVVQDVKRPAIHFLRDFFRYKAKIFKAWIQFQRGNILFLCRKPSVAMNILNKQGQLKYKKEDIDLLKKSYIDAFQGLRYSISGIKQFVNFTFTAFGGNEKCQEINIQIQERLNTNSICSDKKNDFKLPICNEFYENLKFRPFDFKNLNMLINLKSQDRNFEGTGNLMLNWEGFQVYNDPESIAPIVETQNLKKSGNLRNLQLTQSEPQIVIEDVEDNPLMQVFSIPYSGDTALASFGYIDYEGNCAGDNCRIYFKRRMRFNLEGAMTYDGELILQSLQGSDGESSQSIGLIISIIINILLIILLF